MTLRYKDFDGKSIGYKRARNLLRQAQNCVCYLCGLGVREKGHHVKPHLNPTIDHVFPKSKGGANKLGELLVAHNICNNEKRDRQPYPCELIFLEAVNARLKASV